MGLKTSLNSAFTKIGVLRATFGIRMSKIWEAFDIKPTFFLGGVSATGYGLYLNFSLGTALIFTGLVFMTLGYFMEGHK